MDDWWKMSETQRIYRENDVDHRKVWTSHVLLAAAHRCSLRRLKGVPNHAEINPKAGASGSKRRLLLLQIGEESLSEEICARIKTKSEWHAKCRSTLFGEFSITWNAKLPLVHAQKLDVGKERVDLRMKLDWYSEKRGLIQTCKGKGARLTQPS